MNKLYSVIVDETIVQTATYIVLASSPEEARAKAEAGETESQDIDTYSTEITDRQVRDVEEED
jgi:hypothetical protein